MPFWLLPFVILGGLLVVFGVLFVLGRFRGGRYLRPIVQALLKAPLLGKVLQRMSRAALERSNPELASAIRKMERAGVQRDPRRAQQALANLSAAEREAFMKARGSPSSGIGSHGAA